MNKILTTLLLISSIITAHADSELCDINVSKRYIIELESIQEAYDIRRMELRRQLAELECEKLKEEQLLYEEFIAKDHAISQIYNTKKKDDDENEKNTIDS